MVGERSGVMRVQCGWSNSNTLIYVDGCVKIFGKSTSIHRSNRMGSAIEVNEYIVFVI